MRVQTYLLKQTNVEYIFIIILIIVLFALSLGARGKDKKHRLEWKDLLCFEYGKQMSILLKGCACVMILMSHYSTRVLGGGLPKSISYYVTIYAANVALVMFMFISGYGLTVKHVSYDISYSFSVLAKEWLVRLKKVYFPLLFVCLINTILFVIPIHNVSTGVKFLYAIGFADEWYVICVIWFYTFYYLSIGVGLRFKANYTILLTIFMLVYFVVAYYVYGESQAHFYRFPLAFMVGHIIAMRNRNSLLVNFWCALLLLTTLIPLGFHYTKVYALTFLLLILASLIDKVYKIRVRSLLYRLGILSFFFYLTHERIGFRMMSYMGCESCIVWIFITIIIAFLFKHVYDRISFLQK